MASTELRPGTAYATPGSTVSIPIRLATDTNIVAAQFDLLLNSTNLSSADALPGPALADHQLSSAEPEPGVRRVVIYSPTNATLGNGMLVSIPITLASNTPNSTAPLTLTNVLLVTLDGFAVTNGSLLPGSLVCTSSLPQAPVIVSHPVSRGALWGTPAVLDTICMGQGPLSYQWRFNGSLLPGATEAVLILSAVRLEDAGSYCVVVTNTSGAATSQMARLDVETATLVASTVLPGGSRLASVAWGDYDGDGYLDIYLVNSAYEDECYLYRNQGNGTFARVLPNPAPAANRYAMSAAWVDDDNDGDLDLYVITDIAPVMRYRNDGGTLTSVTCGITDYGGSYQAIPRCGAWGDYNRDGWLDVFITSHGRRQNILSCNMGNGTFVRRYGGMEHGYGAWSVAATWVDYNNDGWPDLLVSNLGTDVDYSLTYLYRNLGSSNSTSFAEAGVDGMSSDKGSYGAIAWGDYDNDGYEDLALGNYQRNSRWYHNLGNGDMQRASGYPADSSELESAIALAWGDYDNDGDLDLFAAAWGRKHALYVNRGDGTFWATAAGEVGAETYGYGATWVDYDRDGTLDLLVNNPNGATLYRNSGNSNSWFGVRCLMPVKAGAHRDAIGAKVRVKATVRGHPLWQMREIRCGGEGGGGFQTFWDTNVGNQSPMEAHFGLGDATSVDLVKIEWPDGAEQWLTNVLPRQFLTVNEAPVTPAITVQPIAPSVSLGGTLQMTVGAAGQGSLSFQWRLNDANLAGQTNATLTITNLVSQHAGSYVVVVSSAGGAQTSRVAQISLPQPLYVSQQGRGTLAQSTNASLYPMGQQVTLTATAGRWYQFLRWSDGNTNNPRTITISLTNRYTALFTNTALLEWVVAKQWERIHGGSAEDSLLSIHPTGDGGSMLGGRSDSGQSGNKTTGCFGGRDYWLLALNADGMKLWETNYGGIESDDLRSIQPSGNDGYWLAGFSASGISGNKACGNFGVNDYWIVKTDAQGVKLWETNYGGVDDDRLITALVTPDGGIVLGGFSKSGPGGSKTSGNWGDWDYWVARLDANGVQVWEKDYGGTGDDRLNTIKQTSDGGFLLGGRSQSGTSGNKTAGTFGGYDYWLVKVDANGAKLWETNYGGTDDDQLYSLQPTSDGGCIVGGGSYSTASGNKTTGTFGGYDYWVLRLDPNGVKLWETNVGGLLDDVLYSIEPTDDGGWLLGGKSQSGPSGNKTSPNYGDFDYWLTRLDADGNVQWDASFGGQDLDEIAALETTGDGGYIFGGQSGSWQPPPAVVTEGDTHIDTAQSRFGGASGRFDGAGDGLAIPDFPGFDFGTNAFTVDLWVRFNSLVGDFRFLGRDTDDRFRLAGHNVAGNLYVTINGVFHNLAGVWFPTASVWYHVAVVRDASGDVRVFVDGVQKGSTFNDPGNTDSTQSLKIGINNNGASGIDAWLDEVRVSKGIARWTNNFTPPDAPHVADANTQLLLHMDGAHGATNFVDAGAGIGFGLTDFWVVKLAVAEIPIGTPQVYVNGLFGNSVSNFLFGEGDPIQVELQTSFPDGFIYYSTDGSEPSSDYVGPFTITGTTLIRAVAYDAEYTTQSPECDPVMIEVRPRYALTATTDGGGSISISPASALYLSNTVVRLIAVPDTNWQFLYWTQDASGTNPVVDLTMNSHLTVKAVFGTSVQVTNSGSGVAALNPPQALYPYGSTVWLQAAAQGTGFFRYWDGTLGSNNITPLRYVVTNGAPSFMAYFGTLPPQRYSLSVLSSGAGDVNWSPRLNFYTNNAPVQITATPEPGYLLAGWTGQAAGTNNPLTVVMNANKIITANFGTNEPAANQPPTVAITNPPNGAVFTAPATVTINATAADADGTVAQVAIFAGTNQLAALTNSPYTFAWTNANPGTNIPLTAVATDNLGASATSATVSVTINLPPPGPAVFALSTNAHSVLGNAGSVSVTVLKSLNSLPGTVNYTTADGSAVAYNNGVGNYFAASGSLTFTNGELSKTVVIQIVNLPVYVGDRTFSFLLSASGDGSSVATPSGATITIVDVNSPATTNSWLQTLFPGPVPQHDGQLSIALEPDYAGGQWRLTWETAWRNSRSVIGGLPSGNYPTEFKPVPGFLPPPTATNPVVAGALTLVTNLYAATGNPEYGSLSVTIQPPAVTGEPDVNARGQWRLQGDTNWRDSAFTYTNVIAGSQIVEFKTISGWMRPAPRLVLVGANQGNGISATYLVAPSSGATPPTVLQFNDATVPASGRPYVYCGQLLTEVGYGSGCVVKRRVVLTAAHVLFNDATLAYVPAAHWFFQRYAGTYEPPAQAPRGWYIFDGYAAARTNDNSPGVSSPLSQNLDVAALYFLADAGRGGASGYLVSDPGSTEWLQTSADATLVGYPMEVVADDLRGRPHATSPGNRSFQQVTNRVFSTGDIIGYPGMSGGPLCVQYTNGTYFPAAVFLGGSGQTVVRAINGAVADLINRADVSANTGDNNTGGGVIMIQVGTGGSGGLAYVQVQISPPAAVTAGAAWRLQGTTNWSTGANYTAALAAGGSIALEFKPVPGWDLPTNQTLSATLGQLTVAAALYTRAAQLTVTAASGLASVGYVGGPFDPPGLTYALTNSGEASLDWAAGKSADWLSLAPASGMLPAGGGTNVTLNLNAQAAALLAGTYLDTLTFTNLTTGLGSTSLPVTLSITVPPAVRLTNVTLLANGALALTLQGIPGRVYSLIASTNLLTPLTNWTELLRLTNASGQTTFTSPPPTATPQYYRARQL